jgi:endonuclease/exonuclease/phosphatase (EEP) superfamily protein YafD
MRLLVQNLQKKHGLAASLIAAHSPDIALLQEIAIGSEPAELQAQLVSFVSKLGFGTAVFAKDGASDARRVASPHREFGGWIKKKTTIAQCRVGATTIDCVSFHGYNGSPFRTVPPLVEHVKAVLAELKDGSAVIFAGDFNTWTAEHLQAVTAELAKAGFVHALSWPYPGRSASDTALDHVFLRGLTVAESTTLQSAADHLGAVLELTLSTNSDDHDDAQSTIS